LAVERATNKSLEDYTEKLKGFLGDYQQQNMELREQLSWKAEDDWHADNTKERYGIEDDYAADWETPKGERAPTAGRQIENWLAEIQKRADTMEKEAAGKGERAAPQEVQVLRPKAAGAQEVPKLLHLVFDKKDSPLDARNGQDDANRDNRRIKTGFDPEPSDSDDESSSSDKKKKKRGIIIRKMIRRRRRKRVRQDLRILLPLLRRWNGILMRRRGAWRSV